MDSNISKLSDIEVTNKKSPSINALYLSANYSISKGDAYTAAKTLNSNIKDLELLKLKFISNLIGFCFSIVSGLVGIGGATLFVPYLIKKNISSKLAIPVERITGRFVIAIALRYGKLVNSPLGILKIGKFKDDKYETPVTSNAVDKKLIFLNLQ